MKTTIYYRDNIYSVGCARVSGIQLGEDWHAYCEISCRDPNSVIDATLRQNGNTSIDKLSACMLRDFVICQFSFSPYTGEDFVCKTFHDGMAEILSRKHESVKLD